MTEETSVNYPCDKRAEPRHPAKKFHSVEMKLASLPIYLFKLKDISGNGACFMVKEGSDILEHLQTGQKLNMRYHVENETEPSEVFESEIKHITKALEMPYKGHYLVGIKLLKKQTEMNLQGEFA